jgi:hypothetical protein
MLHPYYFFVIRGKSELPINFPLLNIDQQRSCTHTLAGIETRQETFIQFF